MDNLNKNLGSLRTDITITLHTHYATRVWQGRDATNDEDDKKARIISMPNCLSILGQAYEDASNNDPYADKFIYDLEKKIIEAKKDLAKDQDVILTIMADNIAENIEFERSQSVNPIKIPIFIKSQLGYQLLYLLSNYDAFAKSVLTAGHLALIPKREVKEWINKGSGYIRSIYGKIQQYRHSGITREDVKLNNAKYKNAIERLGQLPKEFLDGTLRADFAPNIRTIKSSDTESYVEPSEELKKIKLDD